MLDDKQFLQWIFERLNLVHKENENFDYMHRLKAIIELMPEGRCSKANGAITKDPIKDRNIQLIDALIKINVLAEVSQDFNILNICDIALTNN